ncbi:tryptophan--tRNA ligase [Geomonas subterranea]|uniref:Tryptophan--tRNA ligase n=1 Tax=Geomonas subterranea TaxID=2847989 RepID=A0ABX8LIT4_9BACT|nr:MULTISPECIES: tryptophan--tRNA ligase [Geomonas]QXE91852.1 tryptophan--tRNA ligase [Geomonas subterranea]QXM10056.1 tryptophan--tRNA ligase [Geomonas subterranea]
MSNNRIVSGMRPTGKLHLGHYHGVLSNWMELQRNFECFFFAADWHSLTTEYASTDGIQDSIDEMVLDWLAFGIDPEQSVIFKQSRVPQHAELNLILSMITPVSWLERNPTYKEMQENLTTKDLSTFGFLGYPVLMASDIIVYKAARVPVGQDQIPHLEITREIARRFNYLYGEVFPEPAALLTETPKVLGIDGRKMSKSYGNAIFLSDDAEETRKKVMSMVTDTLRPFKRDPGEPDRCVAFTLHSLYVDADKRAEIVEGCRSAQLGCVDCKKILAQAMVDTLAPFREKRVELAGKPGLVEEVLAEGSRKAEVVARQTMDEARAALKV